MTHTEVRRRRTALNLTQAQLGAVLGVTYQTVLRWENERVPVPEWLTFALAGIEAYMPAFKKKGGKR